MQVVARQRQKLQGLVKPPRLAKLKAREDAVKQEDSEPSGGPERPQCRLGQSPSAPGEELDHPKGQGALPLTLEKHAEPFFLCSWSTPSQQRPAALGTGCSPIAAQGSQALFHWL